MIRRHLLKGPLIEKFFRQPKKLSECFSSLWSLYIWMTFPDIYVDSSYYWCFWIKISSNVAVLAHNLIIYFISSSSPSIQNLREELTYHANQVGCHAEESSNSHAKFLDARCNKLDEQYTCTTHHMTYLNQAVTKQHELVDGFVNTDFQRDITTGRSNL